LFDCNSPQVTAPEFLPALFVVNSEACLSPLLWIYFRFIFSQQIRVASNSSYLTPLKIQLYFKIHTIWMYRSFSSYKFTMPCSGSCILLSNLGKVTGKRLGSRSICWKNKVWKFDQQWPVKGQLVSSNDQNKSPSISIQNGISARRFKLSSGIAEYSSILEVLRFYAVLIGTHSPVGLVISDFRFPLRCKCDFCPSGLLRCLDW
jgi:hypothetical protein